MKLTNLLLFFTLLVETSKTSHHKHLPSQFLLNNKENIYTALSLEFILKVAKKFVFATAASFAFFDLVKEAVFTVQTHRPKDTIYVYDLGLT